jgi:hypothetical protein
MSIEIADTIVIRQYDITENSPGGGGSVTPATPAITVAKAMIKLIVSAKYIPSETIVATGEVGFVF